MMARSPAPALAAATTRSRLLPRRSLGRFSPLQVRPLLGRFLVQARGFRVPLVFGGLLGRLLLGCLRRLLRAPLFLWLLGHAASPLVDT